ncbi:SRPBCC family protein [Caulobacter sp. BP25]|uniref:SRPBCC family protein n=1 Tax=Caulobacter sp. BP25 TaxID=2048900 RepID=UPI000C12A449|nr:SRPBCC family protein [Caulobacter sp. BP25]PHY19454.1 cyclase [Caulobacter sp. BP25]
MRSILLVLGFAAALSSPASGADDVGARRDAVDVSMGVDEQGHGVVRARTEIAASPEVVYRTLLDCDRAARIMPGVRRCKVVSSGVEGEIREHVVRFSVFLPPLRSTSRVTLEPNRQIRFTCIKGDIRACDGTWRLTPIDGGRRTQVAYDFWASPPFGLPVDLAGRMMRRDAPAALEALRRECERP